MKAELVDALLSGRPQLKDRKRIPDVEFVGWLERDAEQNVRRAFEIEPLAPCECLRSEVLRRFNADELRAYIKINSMFIVTCVHNFERDGCRVDPFDERATFNAMEIAIAQSCVSHAIKRLDEINETDYVEVLTASGLY